MTRFTHYVKRHMFVTGLTTVVLAGALATITAVAPAYADDANIVQTPDEGGMPGFTETITVTAPPESPAPTAEVPAPTQPIPPASPPPQPTPAGGGGSSPAHQQPPTTTVPPTKPQAPWWYLGTKNKCQLRAIAVCGIAGIRIGRPAGVLCGLVYKPICDSYPDL